VTKLLREQLDQATIANKALSAELSEARHQLDARTADFKQQEQVQKPVLIFYPNLY